VIVPPAPLVLISAAAGEAPTVLITPIAVDAAEVEDETANVTVATGPSASGVVFKPDATQMWRPEPAAAHLTDLPADPAAPPATTEAMVTSEGE
jgi:hypothetical protein